VKFIWIKGHNENPENEVCDRLAVKASDEYNLLIDEYYEAMQNKEDLLL